MSVKAVGRAAADLPWLCPNAESLVALAERPADAAESAASDIALLVFLVRFARTAADRPFRLTPSDLASPHLPETARAYLRATSSGWLRPDHSSPRGLRAATAEAVHFAGVIAGYVGAVDTYEASVAARLAPLGLYAAHATGIDTSPDLDYNATSRRLATRWKLPAWVADTVGRLGLPFRVARFSASNPDLFAVVQLAFAEAERRRGTPALTRGADRSELLNHLRLDEAFVTGMPSPPPAAPRAATNPHSVSLIPNLLRMAAEARRRNGASLVVRLEQKVDDLHRTLADVAADGADRVRDARLNGLAELAAGAGHEFNNPLAVIAGHAQRLRQKESDPDREHDLRTIERQTERISGLIRGLMQFARPPKPLPRRWPAAAMLTEVRADLAADALERQITLEVIADADLWADADRDQTRRALRAVALNGLEAAPVGGWVRLGCEPADRGRVAFVVEDSGPGVRPDQREFLFDPFFCGRPAGRGRGLGLSIAWRLATLNGGDLRHEPRSNAPTRFVLTLPDGLPQSERLSA